MPTLFRDSVVVPETVAKAPAVVACDLLCFSHLRWDFVFQRPQHLLTRAAANGRIFFVEEPLFEDCTKPYLRRRLAERGVTVVQPILPLSLHESGHAARDINMAQHDLVHSLVRVERLTGYVSWYYTPMAMAFTADLQPDVVVYDCMDELSAFRGAPPDLLDYERDLLSRADVVFTGGASLYAGKRDRHPNVHLFASSVDVAHFAQARVAQSDPADQKEIPYPRVGFYGVLDERLDLELLRDVARLRPDMQFVLLGPLAKLCPEDLPRAANLHYLGPKRYDDLPLYVSGWDVAILPFALNEATRFISPTKTPEYLATHRPVVSTPIRDVVSPYGENGLVAIAATAEQFAEALDRAMSATSPSWLSNVDAMLATNSWQQTWEGMRREIGVVRAR